ncbi:hypothetical protein DTO271G3_4029 [Paecilomyces variotii]|nr:hypothetical protein DTO271G3_4029 [Paecilomyces variotii]
MTDGEPSYIDYETFLDPDFSPASFANSLVISTNNANDSPLDLSTPLSRVLFDLQEIDTHIHTLTTKSALPLLTHTREQTGSGQRVVEQVEEQVASLTLGYQRLEKEVLRKWEAAEEARVAAENSWATVRLARAVARCLSLGRQLESQLAELSGRGSTRQEHKILSDAAYTIVSLRRLLSATGEGEEGYGLDRVKVVRTLKNELVVPAENTVTTRTQQIIHKFSMSTLLAEENGGSGGSSTYKQALDAKARVISAITTLYILSPAPRPETAASEYRPELLLSTLQGYMHTSLTTSLSALTKALTMLPTLERTLVEISARCQDIVALETILGTLRPPTHPLLESQTPPKVLPTTAQDTEKPFQSPSDQAQNRTVTTTTTATSSSTTDNLLQPLLQSLDTSSLPSYFWRSLASSLRSRVHDIVSRGGVSARTLKSNGDRLRAELRECVLRGSQLPAASVLGREKGLSKRDATDQPVVVGNWEREAAVMVGAVVNTLGK